MQPMNEPSDRGGQIALAVILCLVAVVSLASASGDEGSREEALSRARAAADALTKDLMGTLQTELSGGGPGSAIRVCSEVAQEIAAEHSTGGTAVRRVSRKARNPADRPDPYEAAQLDRLATLHEQGGLPSEVVEVVETGSGGRMLRYLRPITVKPLCLPCHGDPADFAPDVRRVLAVRYPGDQATGYAAGDLRGAVSVTVALE
jgi:hypothetical protein